MDRLCSKIFLLLVTSAVIRSTYQEGIRVHTEPNVIEVCEGASVTINCTFPQINFPFKVKWHYNQTRYSYCLSEKIQENGQHLFYKNSKTWSALYINDITTNESGWYFCKVTQDIPILLEGCSNGTRIIVVANTNSTPKYNDQTLNQTQTPTNQPTMCISNETTPPNRGRFLSENWWIWLALAVGCIVLLVSIIVIWKLTCRSKETIYENTKAPDLGCWRCPCNRIDKYDLPPAKKLETIKPLRNYDSLAKNRNQR